MYVFVCNVVWCNVVRFVVVVMWCWWLMCGFVLVVGCWWFKDFCEFVLVMYMYGLVCFV